MPEVQTIPAIFLVADDNHNLRLPDGTMVDHDWVTLPWGARIRLERRERRQYALGEGVETYTLIMDDSQLGQTRREVESFELGETFVLTPGHIEHVCH